MCLHSPDKNEMIRSKRRGYAAGEVTNLVHIDKPAHTREISDVPPKLYRCCF
jgi:hypothetical protein